MNIFSITFRRTCLVAAAAILVNNLVAIAQQVPTSGSYSKVIGSIAFTVSNGLSFDRVADDSLIQWPIAAVYDAQGDLLVLECHWNRQSVQQQLDSKPHKIIRLRDTDRDGRFDTRTEIADELPFPEGIMLLGDDLLVTAPPHILRLSDKNQDGRYESREVWFDGSSLTHCANDLHGPIMGPDGWVYWTKGAFAEQNHLLRPAGNHSNKTSDNQAEGQPSKAAHIYRRHPTGGPIERLMTGGMDNPSDITFSPEGERFFCSTFLHHPGNGLRDGIAHAPRGGMFGKPHQVLDGHRTTGPLLQPIVNFGPAAPASVNFLGSHSIPRSIDDSKDASNAQEPNRYLASAQFNLQSIGLHQLIPKGASFDTASRIILSGDRIDFHPVDLIEESDGSLLVLDTGGWYDLCCPSSGRDQSIARGGIYRLKPNHIDSHEKWLDPPHEPEMDLQRALGWVADEKQSATLRKKAIWRLAREVTRVGDQAKTAIDCRAAIVAALGDPDASIAQTAAHVVALNGWRHAQDGLVKLLASDSTAAVRASVEALGVVGDSKCIDSLLAAYARLGSDRYRDQIRDQIRDRILEHSVIYSLLEIGASDPTIWDSLRQLLDSTATSQKQLNDEQKRIVLVAIDQSKQVLPSLRPTLVRMLDSPNDGLSALALACLAHQPEGIDLCLPFLLSAWEQQQPKTLAVSAEVILAGRSNEKLVSQVAPWLASGASLSPVRWQWLLEWFRRTNDQPTPGPWAAAMEQWMLSADDPVQMESLASCLVSANLHDRDRISLNSKLSECARKWISQPKTALELLSARSLELQPISQEYADLIVEALTESSHNAVVAERALSRSCLAIESAQRLLDRIGQVPPLALQTVVDSLLRCGSESIDTALLEKLPSIPGTKTLVTDRVLASLNGRKDEMKGSWASMLAQVNQPPADIGKSLDDWDQRLSGGDVQRGYEVFRSAKAACSSCHQVGYLGGRLGPELSQIGKSRTRRDLIEAVVFPSLRLAQGYYPIRVRTIDDEIFNGLLSKQSDTHLELLCGVDKVCRIAKSDIEEQADSKLSVMPAGLEQQMTVSEFADLIAFLESKK
jgi:putative membrane-bound dehydrogenase-like protein